MPQQYNILKLLNINLMNDDSILEFVSNYVETLVLEVMNQGNQLKAISPDELNSLISENKQQGGSLDDFLANLIEILKSRGMDETVVNNAVTKINAQIIRDQAKLALDRLQLKESLTDEEEMAKNLLFLGLSQDNIASMYNALLSLNN